MKVLWSSYSI